VLFHRTSQPVHIAAAGWYSPPCPCCCFAFPPNLQHFAFLFLIEFLFEQVKKSKKLQSLTRGQNNPKLFYIMGIIVATIF